MPPTTGSIDGDHLNAPIDAIVSTPDGKGYWLVATDGGVFSFGDARFYGSMGGQPLNAPVVGLTPTADGKGYWEVATDGGIFAFGDAQFYGSMGGTPLERPGGGHRTSTTRARVLGSGQGRRRLLLRRCPLRGFDGRTGRSMRPVVDMAVAPTGNGYWEVASDGGVFSFGSAVLPRLGRHHDPQRPDRRHRAPTRPTAGTGWSGGTEGSSPTAPRSTGPAERSLRRHRSWADRARSLLGGRRTLVAFRPGGPP